MSLIGTDVSLLTWVFMIVRYSQACGQAPEFLLVSWLLFHCAVAIYYACIRSVRSCSHVQVRSVCDTKQGYTQFGGQRPFGVSILYAGW